MAGPDLSQLSSNWKSLQEKLKTERKTAPPTSNGVKRKRAEPSRPTNGFHKTKLYKTDSNRLPIEKKRRMGSYLSTPPTNHSALVTDHDIDPSALTAAYGPSTATSPSHPSDTPNTGLHPTHKPGKYIALDCEMVGTGPPPHSDNVLARASLVNFHGQQIYDSYVLPPPGITVHDHRTFVSGITPAHLRPGHARPFAQVQRDVATLLRGRILVGHALRNDLNVLVLAHPKRDVRDTSRYAKYRVESKGKPPALRNLARQELGWEIQTGQHSSVEDARAAMMLFRKEKVGFEEENRKRFGSVRKAMAGKATSPEAGEDESDEEDEDEEDLDLLDGEEDEGLAAEMPTDSNPAQPKAKKRKKKKRTKRK